jgi:hypothetical protein
MLNKFWCFIITAFFLFLQLSFIAYAEDTESPLKQTGDKISYKNNLEDPNPKKHSLKYKPVAKYDLIDEFADRILVYVSPIDKITYKKQFHNGQRVKFRIVKNVYKSNGLFIRKGNPVEAVLETIIKPSFGGDPAELIIGRFTTKDEEGNKIELIGEVSKRGWNVLPVRLVADLWWCAPPFSLPLASLYLIRGFGTKISPKNKFKLYYESFLPQKEEAHREN